jgi:hypothetical protein
MHKTEKIFILLLIFLFCIISVFYYYSFGFINYEIATNLIFLIPPFLSVFGGIAAVRAFGIKNRHGKSFLFIALGLLFLFIGESLFAIFQLVLHINPFPSIADIFYLLAYPLMLIGIFREIIFYQSVIKESYSVFISLMLIILSIIIFSIMIIPVLNNEGSVLSKIIASSYGVADILLIVGIAYILIMIINIRGGRLFRAWLYILIATMFMLFGDIFFSYYSIQYTANIPQYKQIDLLWIISYLMFTLGLSEMRFIIHDVQYKLKQLL